MSFRLKTVHWLLIFMAVALPITSTFTLYYPDERHYTDGAMYMLQHGDWLVPHTGAGLLRFEKPILAYWAVAVSWLALGVNSMTARLPFLLACGGTLGLTYHMARRFTGSGATAVLSVIILASQPQFLLSATRNVPDALLTLFVTLSAYGFLRLLALNELTAGAYWMAYGGAAGAVLSKGLLGAGIVLFAWAWFFLTRKDDRSIKLLWDWPSMIFSFLLVASWFAYILATHGTKAWGAFWGDQVTGNIHGHWYTPIFRIPAFSLAVLINFLPWSLTVIEGVWRQQKFSAGHLPGLVRHFVLVWTAVLVVGFSMGSNISLRYTLPAGPLLAMVAADWLLAMDETKLWFSLRRVLAVVILFFCVLCLAIPLMFYQWHAPMFFAAMGMGLLVLFLVALYALAGRRNYFSRPEALGLTLMSFWIIVLLAAVPLVPLDSGYQVAGAVESYSAKPRPVLVVNNAQLANRMRIKLGRAWLVAQAAKVEAGDLSRYKYIVLDQDTAQLLANHGWRPQEISVEPRVNNLRELWRAIATRTLPEYLDGAGKKIYLVIVP